ncbi:AraC family transcriptional regulator [Epilithonimonas sp. JDS]|uniref:AraC family transcriptional regulator n=1 Tax=Epilithonimonas sp. JDS TaxID=2902797 RepID=UPI001E2AD48A|nr:AraC family transcriptional regulator [Epilithonimonas sp. JDS]MCD9856776.1 AraC family transcriptional regulator [Epilithonimonas sp. JDS]
MQHFKSLSELALANGMEPPEHPLLALIRIKDDMVVNHPEFTTDCYMIGLKKVKEGYMLYGRTKLDHQKGSMVFTKPRQVIEMKNLKFEEDGYILFFHEDFLNGSLLFKEIHKYHFFEYEADEALHLAPREEKIIWNIFYGLETEYYNNEDEFSRDIIIAGINSMLRYADRFYKRQFINRRQISGKTVTEFNRVLKQYIDNGHLQEGLPNVSYMATQLNISRRYLTSLLKVETGKTAQELDHGDDHNRINYLYFDIHQFRMGS